MTEPKVGEVDGNGAEVQPSTEVSQSDPKPIQGTFDPQKLMETIQSQNETLETLSKELRGLQGRQDKAESGFQAVIDEFNQLTSKGLSADEAKAQMQKSRDDIAQSELLREVRDLLKGSSLGTATGTDATRVDEAAQKVIQEYGLDGNDPQVNNIVSTTKGTERELALAKLALNQAKRTAPDLSAAPALSGGDSSGGSLSDAEIETLCLKRNTLYRAPTKNAAEIKRIETQLKEAGVQFE